MSNLGWERPKCRAIYAPSVVRCDSCSASAKRTPTVPDATPPRYPQPFPHTPVPGGEVWWLSNPIFVSGSTTPSTT